MARGPHLAWGPPLAWSFHRFGVLIGLGSLFSREPILAQMPTPFGRPIVLRASLASGCHWRGIPISLGASLDWRPIGMGAPFAQWPLLVKVADCLGVPIGWECPFAKDSPLAGGPL